MKKVLILLLAVILFSCQQEASQSNSGEEAKTEQAQTENKKEEKLTDIKFYEETYDFGKISEGEVVTHRFKFKNVGENPLIIKDVKPSCGCTTPNYSKDPVPPGGEGFIDVSFNSKGREGTQHK